MKKKLSLNDHILTMRGFHVMLDSDLARLYGIQTKVLNQAVKRNVERFPSDFMFQLTETEKSELVTVCDRFRNLKHSSQVPHAFTEQGVAMLSGVLRSKQAIKLNVQIVRAFVSMRRFLSTNMHLFQRMTSAEQKLLHHDNKLEQIFKLIEDKELKPKKGIFFDGQIFDAHHFVSDLVRSAKKSIVLIDNFVDDSILVLFRKRKKGVHVVIYTKNLWGLMIDL
jgi:hypothetical protein